MVLIGIDPYPYQAAVSCWKCPNCTCNDPAMYWHIDNIWQYLAIDHIMTYYDHIKPYYDHIMTKSAEWLCLWTLGLRRGPEFRSCSRFPWPSSRLRQAVGKRTMGARRVESSVWNGTCGGHNMVKYGHNMVRNYDHLWLKYLIMVQLDKKW